MTKEKIIRIAIDGPAAAGKSTVAKRIANHLKIVYVDTGAMYRALTYKALQKKVSIHDEEALMQLLKETTIMLSQNEDGQQVIVDEMNVTNEIRSQEVTGKVAQVAKFPLIREEMVKRQQKIADNVSVIMDGRDIGTQVLPQAEVKIFLLASVLERAERRHKENVERGIASNLESIVEEIKQRDHQDMTREVSPLVKAEDAIEIDTTSLSIEQVVEKIMQKIRKVV